MTTILTLTAMFGAIRHSVPKVSYVSFLDIWMLTCMLFIFLCILEFVVVTCFIRANNKRRGEQVESACKLALPVWFFAFNCIYWTVLLLTKGSVPLQNYQNSFQQLV